MSLSVEISAIIAYCVYVHSLFGMFRLDGETLFFFSQLFYVNYFGGILPQRGKATSTEPYHFWHQTIKGKPP